MSDQKMFSLMREVSMHYEIHRDAEYERFKPSRLRKLRELETQYAE